MEQERVLALYDAYADGVYRVALGYLRSAHDAEDAVQAAMVKILSRHQETFFEKLGRSWDETEGWAVLIVEHVAIDMLRKESHTVPLDEGWDAPAPSDTEGEAGYHALRELIDRLPEIYRVVLERRFVLEWDNAEIARELGLSENTVSTRVLRGRKLLQKMMEEEGDGHDGSRV